MRVLVVEDDPETRQEIRLVLEEEGYTVVEARDGRTALSLARERLPDLVLQDLLLPDIAGFQLLEALRRLPGGAPLPVVAVSGFHELLGEARQSAQAFSAYLGKPFDALRLLEVVRAQLGPRLVT